MKQLLFFFFIMVLLSCGGNDNKPKIDTGLKESLVDLEEKVELPKLETFNYEILGTNHTGLIENYYILIKGIPIDEDSLQIFVDAFRYEKCTKSCNICLLDDKKAYPTIKKYPLSKSEYLMVADRFVGHSSLEYTTVSMYPYQDWQYKNYGGKNWKLEPIE
jgi:hypothetical protein